MGCSQLFSYTKYLQPSQTYPQTVIHTTLPNNIINLSHRTSIKLYRGEILIIYFNKKYAIKLYFYNRFITYLSHILIMNINTQNLRRLAILLGCSQLFSYTKYLQPSQTYPQTVIHTTLPNNIINLSHRTSIKLYRGEILIIYFNKKYAIKLYFYNRFITYLSHILIMNINTQNLRRLAILLGCSQLFSYTK